MCILRQTQQNNLFPGLYKYMQYRETQLTRVFASKLTFSVLPFGCLPIQSAIRDAKKNKMKY